MSMFSMPRKYADDPSMKTNARIMPALEYLAGCLGNGDYIKVDHALEFYSFIRRAIPKKDRDILDKLMGDFQHNNDFLRAGRSRRKKHIKKVKTNARV